MAALIPVSNMLAISMVMTLRLIQAPKRKVCVQNAANVAKWVSTMSVKRLMTSSESIKTMAVRGIALSGNGRWNVLVSDRVEV